MRSVVSISIGLLIGLSAVLAQPNVAPGQTSTGDTLSLEQQVALADAITNDAGAPIGSGAFPIAIDARVPEAVQLRPLPAAASAAVPQLRDHRYVAVEEVIAIVEPATRKIVAVLQRSRRQKP